MTPTHKRGTLRRLLGTTLRGRCPACGEGRIFRGVYAVYATCGVCGVRFDRYHGNWLGPTVIGYGVAGVAAAAVGFALVRRYGFFDGLVWVLVAIAATVALVTLRFAKAWWVWLLWRTGIVFPDHDEPEDVSDEGLRC